MTNLERLIKAENVQGGVIADYDRRLLAFEFSGKSFAQMTHEELTLHARKLREAGYLEQAVIVARAGAAHLVLRRAGSL